MTLTPGAPQGAQAQAKTFLMCPPEYFAVEYAINPWMDPALPVNLPLAQRQWAELRSVYASLGHTVHTIDPEPGLPDMVFAANGATVIDGKVLGAKFAYKERVREGPAYLNWFRRNGYSNVVEADYVNEGEGDIVFAHGAIIAGYGIRTDRAVQAQVSRLFGLPVISVQLVDPRFYHVDTALLVLSADTAAYYPPAFDGPSRAALAAHFAELIEADPEDAGELGLNGVCDGRNVVLPVQAAGLAMQIKAAGFTVVPVDTSEFKKSGAGPKCCTLELRCGQDAGSRSDLRPA
jgi:N-dimethylarginine dimethylaminohydrolase